MHYLNPALVFATLALLPAPTCATDLSKVDRRLVKEPAYQSKSPSYCLLVFGPEAATRIWLVVDGHLLYADRNGDGDLTGKNERKRALTWGGEEGTHFEFGALTEISGRKVHLTVRHHAKGADADHLNISVDGRALQHASSDASGGLRFADRASDAPIVHFNGPLRLQPFGEQVLTRDKEAHGFSTKIGTPGHGPGTFAALYCEQVPSNVHPSAEFEFTSLIAGAKPIRLRVSLDQRC